MKIRFVLFFLFLLNISAFAAGRTECGSVKSRYMPRAVNYCALLPPSFDSQPGKKFPALYFLHGLNQDQTFLVSSGAWNVIEDAQEQKRIGEFVVITPEADNSFYINSKDNQIKYEDFFIRDFIPQMENRFHLLTNRSGRAISGVSMGGYGALRTAFKYPQMFVSVSAHMPALLERLPQGSSEAGLNRYLGTAFGRPLDEAYWQANSPFVYAKTANLRDLKIYFDCGDQDDFGFDAGTRQLDKLLTARHIPHITHIYPGTHSGEFVAQHIEESLTFDSRALALRVKVSGSKPGR